jgi:CNT family concentrative nucleoside transporter
MAKLLVPEDGQPITLGRHVKPEVPRESSAIEAIVSGSMAGVKLVVGVAALLVALLGMLALVDLILGGITWYTLGDVWSLQRVLAWVMYPFAVAIGVPPSDAVEAGRLLGERLIITELVTYLDMARVMREGGFTDPRTPVICAYALCGFAHVASLAIFVGGVSALVPERRKDIAAVGPRALLAATLACLMTGAVAGIFFHGGATVLSQ